MERTITCGVFQGSILGPLVFFLYILMICQTPLNSLLLEYLRMIPIFSLPNYNNAKKVESTMNEVGSKILHVLLISYL